MQKNKKLIIALALVLVLAAAFFLVWHFCGPQSDVQEGAKTLNVTIIHGDGSEKKLELHTDEEFLRKPLESEGLISGDESEFGLFIKTVDGETADDALQQWWCLKKGGEMLPTGVDTTPIADGDSFEISLVTGYESFA